VFPHIVSTDIPFSYYPLRPKYVELVGKDKGYTQVMHIARLKDGPKRAMILSQMSLERVLKII
jgi:hypothetical protein